MNNILDHFATAHFDRFLKGQQDKSAYLQPADGQDLRGFQPRTSVGLTLEHLPPR
jgi:hypothetical protein